MTSQTDKAFLDYQAQIIRELKEEILILKQASGTVPPIKHNITNRKSNNNLPFVYEITGINEDDVKANIPITLYISNDPSRGLGTYGTKGSLKNDGPGTITYKLGYDNKWGFPATLKPGESNKIDKDDGVFVEAMIITADTAKTRFRTWWL